MSETSAPAARTQRAKTVREPPARPACAFEASPSFHQPHHGFQLQVGVNAFIVVVPNGDKGSTDRLEEAAEDLRSLVKIQERRVFR